MVDPVRQALIRIYHTIPKPILEAAFRDVAEDDTSSLDSLIIDKVFVARMRDDLSIRCGKVFRLILNNSWCHYASSPSPYALGLSGTYSVYHIPPEAREHRDIAAIMEVRFPYNLGQQTNFYSDCSTKGNTLSSLACEALASQTFSNALVVPRANLRAGNIIKLEPPQFNFVPWQVKVRLKYDDDFTNLEVSETGQFPRLAEQAVKAYIYTTLIIDIESNLVIRGLDMGIFKDIVSSYSDAAEKYDELLMEYAGAAVLDGDRLEGILRKMVPPR